MDTFLDGKYLDGKSSKFVAVKVQLFKDHIEISNEEENVNEIWEIEDIKNIDFSNKKTLHLNYGAFPQKNLLIEDEFSFETIKVLYPQLNRDNLYFYLLKGKKIKTIFYGILGLISVIVIYLFFVAPYISVKVVDLIPQKQEIGLGKKMFETISQFTEFDQNISGDLNKFHKGINFKSDYPIEILYADEDIMNAYAVPGGKIVIYRGLIEKMDDWKQLAGLIAHEQAHVENRHSLKSLSRNLSIYIAISVITTDVSGISTVLIDNAFKLNELSNSRSFEKQADDEGFNYLLNSKINPVGMVSLFEKFEKEEKLFLNDNSKKMLRYISTHPLTEDRIESLKNKITALEVHNFVENKEAEAIFNDIKRQITQK